MCCNNHEIQRSKVTRSIKCVFASVTDVRSFKWCRKFLLNVFILQSIKTLFLSVHHSHYLQKYTLDEYLHISGKKLYILLNYAEILLKAFFLELVRVRDARLSAPYSAEVSRSRFTSAASTPKTFNGCFTLKRNLTLIYFGEGAERTPCLLFPSSPVCHL